MNDEEFESFQSFMDKNGGDVVNQSDFEELFKNKFPGSKMDFKTSTVYTNVARAKFERVQSNRSVWVRQEDIQYIEQETDETYFLYLYRREHPLYVRSTPKFIEEFWGISPAT